MNMGNSTKKPDYLFFLGRTVIMTATKREKVKAPKMAFLFFPLIKGDVIFANLQNSQKYQYGQKEESLLGSLRV